MSCRETPGGSVALTLARAQTPEASDADAQAAFHAARRDAAGAADPTPGEVKAWVTEQRSWVADAGFSPARLASITRRLDEMEADPSAYDGPTFAAISSVADDLPGRLRAARSTSTRMVGGASHCSRCGEFIGQAAHTCAAGGDLIGDSAALWRDRIVERDRPTLPDAWRSTACCAEADRSADRAARLLESDTVDDEDVVRWLTKARDGVPAPEQHLPQYVHDDHEAVFGEPDPSWSRPTLMLVDDEGVTHSVRSCDQRSTIISEAVMAPIDHDGDKWCDCAVRQISRRGAMAARAAHVAAESATLDELEAVADLHVPTVDDVATYNGKLAAKLIDQKIAATSDPETAAWLIGVAERLTARTKAEGLTGELAAAMRDQIVFDFITDPDQLVEGAAQRCDTLLRRRSRLEAEARSILDNAASEAGRVPVAVPERYMLHSSLGRSGPWGDAPRGGLREVPYNTRTAAPGLHMLRIGAGSRRPEDATRIVGLAAHRHRPERFV